MLCSALVATLALIPVVAWSHGGGLDSYGCHQDRAHSEYHCHQGPLAGQHFVSQADMLAALPHSLAPSAQPSAPIGEFSGRVVGVSDGDTITVMHNGRGEKILLYGIDCPEKGQRYGTKAKKFTSKRAFRKQVTVIPKTVDRFGRTVAVVILPDGANLNEELVKAGLAWWYQPYVPFDDTLRELEKQARDAKRGLWADPHAVAPWCYRMRMRGPEC